MGRVVEALVEVSLRVVLLSPVPKGASQVYMCQETEEVAQLPQEGLVLMAQPAGARAAACVAQEAAAERVTPEPVPEVTAVTEGFRVGAEAGPVLRPRVMVERAERAVMDESHLLQLSNTMAVYTPATLITSKAFGNGAANIGTWQKQNTAGAGTFDIYRTTVVCTAGSARHYTLEQGATAADTAAQKIVDTFFITPFVPDVRNWWIAIPNNGYFGGFADNTDIIGAGYGYTFA